MASFLRIVERQALHKGHSLVKSLERQHTFVVELSRRFCEQGPPKLPRPGVWGSEEDKDGASGDKPKTKKVVGVRSRRPFHITWYSASLSAVAAVLCIGGLSYLRQQRRKELERVRKRSLGKAKIATDFELVDCDNNPRKSKDFSGQWLLVYFGFTHCPDICPEELQKMATIIDEMDKLPDKPKVQPIFITVDPYRDTPESICKYCAEFTPRLLGLTGTIEQIKQACKSYRVYFSAGPQDMDNDYIVDHTVLMYLVDPEGQFVDFYGLSSSADNVVNSIIFQMNAYDAANKISKKWLTLDIFKND